MGDSVWDDRAPHRTSPPVGSLPGVAPVSGTGGAIRVTNEQDGELVNRQYSYWPAAWLDGPDHAIVFAGRREGYPLFFGVTLSTRDVERIGSPVPYGNEADGWYWDADGGITFCDGPVLRRVHPFTGANDILFSIAASHPNCRLWQAHSSDDRQTHSATVQQIANDGPYLNVSTVVSHHGTQTFYTSQGALDESQVTPDGAFLVIKDSEDNIIIDLAGYETRILRDADGAVGHSDCGPSLLVGEDNIHGACVAWDLRLPLTEDNRRTLFSTWGMGHLSIRGGRCLRSDATHLSMVNLESGGVTPFWEHGMTGSGYDYQVKANLDPTGRVACYMSNYAGRMDLYVVPLSEP